MKFPSTSSQGNPLAPGPSGSQGSQPTTTSVATSNETNPAQATTSPSSNTVNGHKSSVIVGGPMMSSTPLVTTAGPTSGAMSAASNFFRRYTSTNSQDGAAKQSTDQNETPLNWKTLNETSESEATRPAETMRQQSEISEAGVTAIEMKNMTAAKKSDSRTGIAAKLPKPGKSRKNSRAPPPPQMTTTTGAKSASRKSRLPHESVQRPCQTHSFHTDAAEVQHMEEGLLKLLDDFNSGKLRAFGQGCSMEQMEAIRDQQESLAKLHFDLGGMQDPFAPLSEEGLRSSNDNMDKLMNRLEKLSVAIGELNPAASAPTTPSAGTAKKSDRSVPS